MFLKLFILNDKFIKFIKVFLVRLTLGLTLVDI